MPFSNTKTVITSIGTIYLENTVIFCNQLTAYCLFTVGADDVASTNNSRMVTTNTTQLHTLHRHAL